MKAVFGVGFGAEKEAVEAVGVLVAEETLLGVESQGDGTGELGAGFAWVASGLLQKIVNIIGSVPL